MRGILIRNSFWHSASTQQLEALFVQASQALQIDLTILGNSDILCDISGVLPEALKSRPDFILFWDKDVRLAQYLEELGISVFNSSQGIALCDNKLLTHLALKNSDLPMPDTILCPLTYQSVGYPSMDFLKKAAERLTYPLIIKEGCGSFGQQVYLARDEEQAKSILLANAGKDMLLQRFIQESTGHDKRLYMVGGKCVAAMRRINQNDFRANIAAGGTAEAYTPNALEISMAKKACEQLHLSFGGVDLLDSIHGPLLCEVNSNAHFTALQQLTNVNVALEILDFIRGTL